MRVRNKPAALGIYLRPTPDASVRVGSLYRDPEGAVTFTVDMAYVALGAHRPILSLAWKGQTEDGPKGSRARLLYNGDKITQGSVLPPYFENLLPEGALLELVQKEFGAGAFDNFDVLSRLGRDLPGAVSAELEAGAPPPRTSMAEAGDDIEEGIRFSLAGIQLKFSMKQNDKGSLTLPMKGAAGDIILKTPSDKYPMVPEAEFTALELARAVGVRTVKAHLVSSKDIDGLPQKFLAGGEYSLAMERFDRAPGGRRIHMEDFAQVMGSIHDQKYTMANQSTLVRLVGLFADDKRGEMLQAIRRIVVDVMIGNGDSHLKNWSFILPDGVTPELSPAYDIVPTFFYGDDTMALEFAKSHNPAAVNTRRFERLAGLVGLDTKIVLREVKDTVEQVLDVWPRLLPNLPAPPGFAEKLTERWKGLSITREFAPTMLVSAEPEDEPSVIAPR
ncbi:serine/threonine-protein kinase HipA [Bradyrhizobium sp. USDA 4341]